MARGWPTHRAPYRRQARRVADDQIYLRLAVKFRREKVSRPQRVHVCAELLPCRSSAAGRHGAPAGKAAAAVEGAGGSRSSASMTCMASYNAALQAPPSSPQKCKARLSLPKRHRQATRVGQGPARHSASPHGGTQPHGGHGAPRVARATGAVARPRAEDSEPARPGLIHARLRKPPRGSMKRSFLGEEA